MNLVDQITKAIDLPDDLISEELDEIITKAGLDPKKITLEDLRHVLADYLQEVLLAAKIQYTNESIN